MAETAFELEVSSIPQEHSTVEDVSFLARTSPSAAGRDRYQLSRLGLAPYDRMNPENQARWWPFAPVGSLDA